MKLVLATTNKRKRSTFVSYFQTLPVALSFMGATVDVEETESSFCGNAEKKAAAARGNEEEAIIVSEDSGLVVPALDGFPGVRTARFMEGTDDDRAKALIQKLDGVPMSKRQAYFVSVIVIDFPNGEKKICRGEQHGWVEATMKGKESEGYTRIFLRSNGCTLSEDNEEAKQVNHRTDALYQATSVIEEWLNANG
ncbi:non-canonical purine NTP pyrophosphatase [Shouchella shacheensis]|uniref:non-canonical purine NTP pyrophosphatase n=1 Tax=Shouchella shacheensis TaxID=1649580 RepID=UPI000740214E|nr:non-canonical purine NTP pyrophosphatase [Shouchella shacheensis]